MKGESVLVTGAEGFIGSHLVEALITEGHNVKALIQYNHLNSWGWLENLPASMKSSVEVISGDLRDFWSVRESMKGCRKAFHLGALIAIPYSYRAPKEYIETNVGGTLNVMQAALELGLDRVIHTSTSEVYGSARSVPMDESHPLQAQSPYAASKIGADKIAESFFCSFKLPVLTVRPFNTYGPRQSARAVIPTIITQALREDSIRLGSLTPVRDLTFVKDTVLAFLKAAKNTVPAGETIHLGTGIGVSIGDLVKLILESLGINKPVIADESRERPPESEVMRLIANNEKAATILGWKPEVSLKDGIKLTVEWFRNHHTLYKTKEYVL